MVSTMIVVCNTGASPVPYDPTRQRTSARHRLLVRDASRCQHCGAIIAIRAVATLLALLPIGPRKRLPRAGKLRGCLRLVIDRSQG